MKEYKLIRNGNVATKDGIRRCDVLLRGDRIERVEEHIECADAEIIDASGKLVTYSFADVHVHFREPGRPDKETILTGSQAAAKGGYGCVCPMPNLDPAPDTVEHIEEELSIIRRDAVIDVRPYATITLGRKGIEAVDVKALKPLCAGFSDDGSGVQDEDVMRGAMRLVTAEKGILAAHCEDNTLLRGGYIHDGEYAAAHGHKGICSESEWGQIARDVRLAAETGCAYHVCHISTKESVEIIRKAKAAGVDVTCETGPHYLTLCDADLQEEGRFKMNPPLRGAGDRDALIEGILDGTVDMIATDHAPHTAEEKSRGLQGSAMGITGLETAFPVIYTKLVRTGIVSIERVLELMCTAPRKRFALGGGVIEAGARADIAIFDLDTPYRIDSATFLSKGHATPFDGWEVYGRCVLNIHKGKTVYKF